MCARVAVGLPRYIITSAERKFAQGPTPPGMTFEAAWGENGAICLSHARWSFNGAVVAAACPNRLQPPSQGHPGTVCDSVAEALMLGGANSRLFNESAIGP